MLYYFLYLFILIDKDSYYTLIIYNIFDSIAKLVFFTYVLHCFYTGICTTSETHNRQSHLGMNGHLAVLLTY